MSTARFASATADARTANHQLSWRQAALALLLLLITLPASAMNRSVPIRWCIVEGAPAADNPGAVNESTTDDVAWRRHERPSDAVFIPQADVTLRSSLRNIVPAEDLNFPIIPDQDTSDPDHQEGDVLQPLSFDSTEWNNTYDACVEAWEDELGIDDIGVVAVIARRVVDPAGTPDVFAVGYFGARRVLLEDNAWSLCGSSEQDVTVCDAVDKTFGHEIGHTLPTELTDVTSTSGLRHTCTNDNMMRQGRQDTDGDNVLDNFNLSTSASQVTGSGGDGSQCTGDDSTETIDQIDAFYEAAAEVPGCVISGTNDACGTQRSDVHTDSRGDADLAAVNLASVRLLDSSNGTTRVVHELDGRISPNLLPETTLEYFAFLDLDGNSATGGAPSSLGLDTNFAGAELVTRVQVGSIAIPIVATPAPGDVAAAADAQPPLFAASATVWRFQDGQFQLVNDKGVRGQVKPLIGVGERMDGSSFEAHVADRVEVTFPTAVRGAVATPLQLQAMTRAVTPETQTQDKLDDTPEEAGLPFRLGFPTFPLCRVTPNPTFAGGIASVSVSGLVANRGFHVVFGDTEVTTGSADGAGVGTANFSVPLDASAGPHLVTVGSDGTALTADCIVDVEAAQVRYEYAAKLVCGVQPQPRRQHFARGFYATSVNVHNPGAPAKVFYKLALAGAPDGKEQIIRPLGYTALQHDGAVAFDCDTLRREAFPNRSRKNLLDAFLVLQSTGPLDVEGVYSTATLNAEGSAENHSSLVVRRVPERERGRPPRPEPEPEKVDLVVKDIDLNSLRVRCPGGGGTCVTRVDVTVANAGSNPAGPFVTRTRLDPNQTVVVDDAVPGLGAGATRTINVVTPPGGNCFDPDCRICVTVDQNDTVAETDEGNNTLCRIKQG